MDVLEQFLAMRRMKRERRVSKMRYESNNELYHHGIKGQKWGIRRFQNADGSLTNKGRSRYSQGKEVYKEHDRILNAKHAQLKKQSKAYQKASKDYDRLTKKYDLDSEEDQELHDLETGQSSKERDWAAQKRWSLADDIDTMDEAFYDKAMEYANKQIIEKYGDIGISNMKHYQNVNAGIAFLATGVGAAIMLAAVSKK